MAPTRDLFEMEIFARIVSLGSMTAASQSLGISAAVVSKRMKKLEDRLGTRLLQRTTRQIALTEAGQDFYDHVQIILERVEEAEAAVTQRSSQVRGHLTISIPTSFGRMHVAPHLGPFLRDNSGLSIDLHSSDDFIDLVGDGYDLAIRIGALPDSSLVARKLAPIHRLLCASPDYLDRYGEPANLNDLADHVCLAAHNQDPWRLEGPDGTEIIRTQGILRSNSSEVIRSAVIAGIGIGLRSSWDVGDELRDGRLKVILPQYRASSQIGLYVIYPSRRFLPAKVRLFIDYLAELYGTNPYWDNGLDAFISLPTNSQ
ncbi:LysR family transcriptional regulator [Cohaesibacter gelatinilyticus]|uniref:Transcriptional regulator, LysR family n=1 Tax=Cohaesibacter gelatinilyticus TaxID=372072 RepID=A0A285NCI7_9HYPH|nr:LysR family transcriptional regulator [Cohaesibacter gelatinilyticus]SNZ05656.1 transcriptional regulator, LysR family [Cohaesibacter gelatinilyticus]